MAMKLQQKSMLQAPEVTHRSKSSKNATLEKSQDLQAPQISNVLWRKVTLRELPAQGQEAWLPERNEAGLSLDKQKEPLIKYCRQNAVPVKH